MDAADAGFRLPAASWRFMVNGFLGNRRLL
jgi:hypothetical protein